MTTAFIKTLIDDNDDIVYPQTKVNAIYDNNGNLLSDVIAYRPTVVNATLSESNWDINTKTYSFEDEYPSANYDVQVDIDGDNCSDEQLEAWLNAKPLGSSSNVINAKGVIPTIAIPVILSITSK